MTFWLVLTRSGEEHSFIQQIFQKRARRTRAGRLIATVILIITCKLPEGGRPTASDALVLSGFAASLFGEAHRMTSEPLDRVFQHGPFIGGAFSKSRTGSAAHHLRALSLSSDCTTAPPGRLLGGRLGDHRDGGLVIGSSYCLLPGGSKTFAN